MRKIFKKLFQNVLLLVLLSACARDISDGLVYRIENHKVIFEFTAEQLREMTKGQNGDLDDFKDLIKKRLEKVDSLNYVGMDGWQFVQIDSNLFQFTKDLSQLDGKLEYSQKMMFEKFMHFPSANYSDYLPNFGYLPKKVPNIFEKEHGTFIFHLPDFKQAEEVFLCGTFNKWNTISNPMVKTDSGWVTSVYLKPGYYEYKYIVDGLWTEDPNNEYSKQNEHFSLNSIFVVPNYTFTLNGFQNATEVVLSGEFVNWSENQIIMRKKDHKWQASVYLEQGQYAYKYIVDKNWILDPENSKTKVVDGHTNSLLNLGDAYTFNLLGYSSAKSVFCTGSFVDWDKDSIPMKRTQTGWTCEVVLPKGNYEYKFLVDGQWTIDQHAEFLTNTNFGEKNMWLVVGEPKYFKLEGFEYATEVIVSGTFNNWNKQQAQMKKVDGAWTFPAYLKPGKQLYKFIVDGIWMTDPKNTQNEPNREGTYNSVIWVEG